MNLSIQILIALILSVVAGLAAGAESLPFINQWIAPIGTIFINLIKMMIVPVVFCSLIVGVTSLGGDGKKVRKAVFLGLLNNFILITVITVCALLSSTQVTEVAMIGWSKGIGSWAEMVGSLFTILAMLTTYWSISLALADIVEEQLKLSRRLCWVIATLPSLALTFAGLGGFMEFMRLAGGLIAILIALLVVPAFRKASREPGDSLLGRWSGGWMQILIIIAYVLMAVGNVVKI